jgi:DNA polymerase IV
VLEDEFGRYGVRLYELAHGIDGNKVVPYRPPQSMSVEDTFEKDVLLLETEPMIRRLAEKLWSASRKEPRVARTVVLKLKTSEFKILTRSHTPDSPPSSCEELTDIALTLRERVALDPQQRFRLVGIGLSNFREPEGTRAAQPALFESRQTAAAWRCMRKTAQESATAGTLLPITLGSPALIFRGIVYGLPVIRTQGVAT